MTDLAVAVGLVLVLEGLLWAVAPHLALRMLAAAAQMPEGQLRVSGWIAIAVGMFIVWLIRG
ncbi:MAG: DUF2065 family protein [Hyphomicrobiaceae bacterium]|nr:DUF2065 family protein [Hyphomicrobiaceae bacterium]